MLIAFYSSHGCRRLSLHHLQQTNFPALLESCSACSVSFFFLLCDEEDMVEPELGLETQLKTELVYSNKHTVRITKERTLPFDLDGEQ